MFLLVCDSHAYLKEVNVQKNRKMMTERKIRRIVKRMKKTMKKTKIERNADRQRSK